MFYPEISMHSRLNCITLKYSKTKIQITHSRFIFDVDEIHFGNSYFMQYCNSFFFSFCCSFADDTYMYDDAARGSIRPHQMGHWYDEPPYESDPDDFLMSGINSGPAAIIQVRTFFSLFFGREGISIAYRYTLFDVGKSINMNHAT